MIQAIYEEVEERARAASEEVFLRAVEEIKSRECPRRLACNNYSYHKIKLHHMKRYLSNNYGYFERMPSYGYSQVITQIDKCKELREVYYGTICECQRCPIKCKRSCKELG